MSPFVKDLGELSSMDQLHTSRLDATEQRVLSIVESRGRVSPSSISEEAALPRTAVVSSLVDLASAGLVELVRTDGSVEAVVTRHNR